MKKTLSLVLCMLLVLTIFGGCGPQAGAGETTAEATQPEAPVSLSVGFGRGDITPRATVPLGGLKDSISRLSDRVRDPLYTTCIAFTDGAGNTAMLFVSDLLSVFAPMAEARAEISKTWNIPVSNIWIATTHNHSGPALNEETDAILMSCQLLREQMIYAANQAMEDRKPAKMLITDTHPVNLNFVRHYVMNDGSIVGDNFGDTVGREYVKHVSEVDNQMQLLKFVREDAKDIILMNWQGHPTGHDQYRNSILSGPTVAARKMESTLDCHFAYVLGASGNVNNKSRIASERVTTDYVNHYETLAQHAIDAESTYREVEVKNIRFHNEKVACTVKVGSGKLDIPLSVFSIGDVAFVAAPYEMFDTNGMFVKENSPFEMTFVSSCTNGSNSYIPTESTFEYGGYEVGNSLVAPGSAEQLADAMVAMLKQVK